MRRRTKEWDRSYTASASALPVPPFLPLSLLAGRRGRAGREADRQAGKEAGKKRESLGRKDE